MLEKGSSFATGATNATSTSGDWFSTAVDNVGKWFSQAGSDLEQFFAGNWFDYALDSISKHGLSETIKNAFGTSTSSSNPFLDLFDDILNGSNPNFKEPSGSGDSSNGATDTEEVDPLQKLIDDFFSKYASSTESANLLAQQNATTAMNFEREEAEKLRQWQEYMESTYWQRQRKSMEDAGFNPWMAIYGKQTPSYSSSLPSSSTAETFRSQEKISDYIMLFPLLIQLGRVLWSSLSNSSSKNPLLSLFK